MGVGLGDYRREIVRAAAILTNSYVAGTVIKDIEHCNQLVLLFAYTKGSLTSLQYKIEFSDDGGATYYQEIMSVQSSGTSTDTVLEHTFTGATANFRVAIPIKDSYIRVSAIGTGTVTSSSLAIQAILGTV